MKVLSLLAEFWHYLLLVTGFLAAVIASSHAVIRKRDSRSAVMWVGVIWLSPIIGPLLYLLFGINRIERKALSLWQGYEPTVGTSTNQYVSPEDALEHLPPSKQHLKKLVMLVNGVTRRPLLTGNAITVLDGGDSAYPEMLAAIDGARDTVNLLTYIFDYDAAGEQFIAALIRAVKRGVDVRVLIDDAGARYSKRPVSVELQRKGVLCHRFLRTLDPLKMMGLNLRNHRKIMVVDGRIGFTGGMNIREGSQLSKKPVNPIRDIHFRVGGPVVAHLQEAFADDWLFVTGEGMTSQKWFPQQRVAGEVLVRGISDGPDAGLRKLRWAIVGALNSAQHSVKIVTPYFLPDEVLVSALNQAARRGVNVDVLLPKRGNLPFVQWAMYAGLWKILQHGVRVWLTPEPFDHAKLLVVDSGWSLIGSSNWDPRSLRLNFEFNLECYDQNLAAELERIVDGKIEEADHLTMQDVDNRSFPIRLRDGFARLFTPFL
jgi:cardiolipin synthase A/B